jgi:hypothetical protein
LIGGNGAIDFVVRVFTLGCMTGCELFLGDMGGERLDDVDDDDDDADDVDDERLCTIDSISLIFDLTLALIRAAAALLGAVSMSTSFSSFELSCNDLLIDFVDVGVLDGIDLGAMLSMFDIVCRDFGTTPIETVLVRSATIGCCCC